MTVTENKARLDNHAERIRQIEVRLGKNNIVGEVRCRERIATQEARVTRVEKKVVSMDLRLWGLLAIALATLAKVAWG